MSQKEKLISRFNEMPKDFTFNELTSLLSHFGYQEIATGKTSGSAVHFSNEEKHMIRLHKPHPGNIVKFYILKMVKSELEKGGS